jgi:ethanolamine utilization protein EutP (predicted NTPase)
MSSPSESDNTAINIGVSKALSDIKSGLIEVGNDLESLLHTRISWFIRDMRSSVESNICRIAFVGQVKAGKSSLINALIKRPGFLPTDINPSTAVVTKVFLGSSEQNENTAHFHFFTESEWEGIMSGAESRDAKGLLALPSSREKLGDLQRRAEKRLGPNYSKVLGKHHLFSSVTPQLLDQYVSATDYKSSAPESPVLYSDVTKMAEVFLKGLPFSLPSVMIDTPGVNDLFFIRDEITHSNLADADIYIVVLSAQNPLSSADISLLRLLRGLQRDKIIAVINRIDGLDNITEDTRRVEAYVRDTLKHEFPHSPIPVLLASALWANTALKGDPEEINRVSNARYDRYAQEHRALRKPQNGKDAIPNRSPAALLACSGIPRIIEFISRFISTSVTEEHLLPAAATFTAVAHNTATSSRLALRALAPDKLVRGLRPVPREELRRQAKLSLDQLTEVVSQVEQLLNAKLQEWESHAANEVVNLERYLFYAIDVFADAQAKAFISQRETKGFTSAFFKDALSFRSELSDNFALHHMKIIKGLLDKQNEAEAVLRRTVQAKLPNLDSVLQFGFSCRKTRPPSVMALAKATTLETEEFWALLKDAPAAKEDSERLRELKIVITSEFLLILREMLETARADLKLTANEMMTRLRLMALSAIFPLIENLSYLSESFLDKKGSAGAAVPIDPQLMVDFQSHIKLRVTRQEEIEKRLNIIKKQCLHVPIG